MTTRKRLPPEESRAAALHAARQLLIETGPQSVTLKAVAARVDRTHANLLHHFGSAAGLQKALAAHIALTVKETVGEAVKARRAGIGNPAEVVDLTFDAFDREGGGALTSWLLLSGNEDAIAPIVETMRDLVDELHPQELEAGVGKAVHESTLALVLLALGNALMGQQLADSLGVERKVARQKAAEMLTASLIDTGEFAAQA